MGKHILKLHDRFFVRLIIFSLGLYLGIQLTPDRLSDANLLGSEQGQENHRIELRPKSFSRQIYLPSSPLLNRPFKKAKRGLASVNDNRPIHHRIEDLATLPETYVLDDDSIAWVMDPDIKEDALAELDFGINTNTNRLASIWDSDTLPVNSEEYKPYRKRQAKAQVAARTTEKQQVELKLQNAIGNTE